MAITLSNHLKAIIYPSNILAEEVCRIPRDRCFTVLHFNYECARNRNKAGFPFGETTTTILKFTIRLLNPEDGKIFYKQMRQNEPGDFTFMFNTNLQQRAVDVEDDFTTTSEGTASTEQMLIHVQLLVASITYIGTNGNRVIAITRK